MLWGMPLRQRYQRSVMNPLQAEQAQLMTNCPRVKMKKWHTFDCSPGIQSARGTLAQFQGHCPSGSGSPRNSGRLPGSEGNAPRGDLERIITTTLLRNSGGEKSEER